MAVAVSRGDRIVWEEGFGWADRERHRPADANTMYSLASISKPLTATALMTLVRAGKVDLDRPINDYLGAAKLRARIGNVDDATVRRVANHSSGLPEYFQFYYENESARPPAADVTIRRFGNLVGVPGEHYQYSNLGYGILGEVISRVSGESYSEYIRKAVFLKLGMTHTSVYMPPDLAQYEAIRYDGEELAPIVPYRFDHDGASAIYSSVHDLIRFAQFQLKEHLPDQAPILSDAMIDEMQRPTIYEKPGVAYGIGWERNSLSGYSIVGHSGGMPGAATWLRLVPSEHLAVAVLCNEDDRLAHIIMDQIMAAVLPGYQVPTVNPSPTVRPFLPPPELVGEWKGHVSTYISETPLTLRVLGSGKVEARMDGQVPVELTSLDFTADGYFRGMFEGRVALGEVARRPYRLSIYLKLRDGTALNGAISARADQPGMMDLPQPNGLPVIRGEKEAFIITQWCELTKL